MEKMNFIQVVALIYGWVFDNNGIISRNDNEIFRKTLLDLKNKFPNIIPDFEFNDTYISNANFGLNMMKAIFNDADGNIQFSKEGSEYYKKRKNEILNTEFGKEFFSIIEKNYKYKFDTSKPNFSKLWISNSTEDQTYTSHILRWSCENPHLYVYADIHNYCNGYWNFKAELNAINPRVYISMRDCEHVGTLEDTKTMIEGLLNSFIERCQK